MDKTSRAQHPAALLRESRGGMDWEISIAKEGLYSIVHYRKARPISTVKFGFFVAAKRLKNREEQTHLSGRLRRRLGFAA